MKDLLTPLSAQMPPSVPLPSASGSDRLVRLESKFPLVGAELAIRLLEIHWRPDSAFPSNQVFTIHFDTPSLDAYAENRSGDFVKTKVRVRWYADGEQWTGPARVRLEAKRKFGLRVEKSFLLMEVPSIPQQDCLDNAFWAPLISQALPALAPDLRGPLMPVLLSRYHRRRFVDPWGSARASLDTGLTGLAVSPWAAPARTGPLQIPGTVLEIKRQAEPLPDWIRLIPSLREQSFSKYAVLLGRYLNDQ